MVGGFFKIPCAVAEERMNLIEFADFLLISLTDFFLYHRSLFSISQFSLHNKIILLPRKTYLHPKSPAQYLIVVFAVK